MRVLSLLPLALCLLGLPPGWELLAALRLGMRYLGRPGWASETLARSPAQVLAVLSVTGFYARVQNTPFPHL